VSALNEQIKSLLESTFLHLSVEGEIGSVTYHTSGHIYFNVKDAQSSIKCVMFKSNAKSLKFKLEAGQKIIVHGSLSVYKPRGEYQLYAVNIEPYGAGALALAFEQLKKKLMQQGYFENKKNIPKNIKDIAIVTSKSGAAIADMLKVIQKRWPLVKVTIIDTLVQGAACANEIAKHIRYADLLNKDVIIVGRGGGSVEDLWGFNEEVVAQAIFEAKTPIVSAVGHEVDLLISDMVADLRAPTPSAAIEMILPDKNEILFLIDEHLQRFKKVFLQKTERLEYQNKQLASEFARFNPKNRLQRSLEEIRELQKRYKNAAVQMQHYRQKELENLQKQFALSNPKNKVAKNSALIYKAQRSVALDAIEQNEEFVLQDANTSLTARCIDKQPL
jgi:exodeoxyribonuclease VII large subunit